MTGRERFEAALAGLDSELAVGVAYPGIPLRDRMADHSDAPWWVLLEADPDVCLPVIRHFLEAVDCDWWSVGQTAPRDERACLRYGRDEHGDFVIDTRTGSDMP